MVIPAQVQLAVNGFQVGDTCHRRTVLYVLLHKAGCREYHILFQFLFQEAQLANSARAGQCQCFTAVPIASQVAHGHDLLPDPPGRDYVAPQELRPRSCAPQELRVDMMVCRLPECRPGRAMIRSGRSSSRYAPSQGRDYSPVLRPGRPLAPVSREGSSELGLGSGRSVICRSVTLVWSLLSNQNYLNQ